jgi:ATP-dependent RNA helicase DDX60
MLVKMEKLSHSGKLDYLDDLSRNPQCQELVLGTEIRVYRLHILLKQWIEDPENNADVVRDRYTVAIIRIIKDVYDRKHLTPKISDALSSTLISLGFSNYAAALEGKTPVQGEKSSLSFDFVKLVKSKTKVPIYPFMHITEDPTLWQLRLFGEFMDRSFDSKPDPRVAFEPDAWQRDVLDCIDRNESLLVIGELSCHLEASCYLNSASSYQRGEDIYIILCYGENTQKFR